MQSWDILPRTPPPKKKSRHQCPLAKSNPKLTMVTNCELGTHLFLWISCSLPTPYIRSHSPARSMPPAQSMGPNSATSAALIYAGLLPLPTPLLKQAASCSNPQEVALFLYPAPPWSIVPTTLRFLQNVCQFYFQECNNTNVSQLFR